MKTSTLIWQLVIVIIIFSLVPIGELWLLKQLGLDVIAHMQAASSEDSNIIFYFEAFGAVAFILAQTVILTGLFIMGIKKLGPVLIRNAVNKLISLIN